MSYAGIAQPCEGADMGMDINIEVVENGVVVRTHDKVGEGEDVKYIDETRVFQDLSEFQEWFGTSKWAKSKRYNKEKGLIEDAVKSE